MTTFLSSMLLSVHVTFEFLQPPVESKEIDVQAEPDADRDDQHDIELVLGEKIHSYPFGWW
jgi:hypothetical protein